MQKKSTALLGIVLLALTVVTAGTAEAAGERGGTQPTVFKAETAEGQVWVDVDLTRHRTSEPYIPVVVAVSNRAKQAADFNRSSFTMVGADGKQESMGTIEGVRKDYGMLNFDMSMIRVYGMPVGTWLQESRLVPSNFFPVLGMGSGVAIDHVELPPLYWMIDVLYFKRPAGLAEGQDIKLIVHPKGWESPVTVVFHV